MDRYPEREVVLNGVYCQAQVLNPWKMDPPKYVHVNSLDDRRPGEWIVEQRMGAWMNVDMFSFVRRVNEYAAETVK
jgi:hypothetical protein